jgi:hypothetical protein
MEGGHDFPDLHEERYLILDGGDADRLTSRFDQLSCGRQLTLECGPYWMPAQGEKCSHKLGRRA